MRENNVLSGIGALGRSDHEPQCVLLVEDNIDHQRLMTVLLGRLNVTPILARNGQEGFEAILGGEPTSLILMDLHMPRFDGYEATRQIRQWEAQNKEPRHSIIALTADTDDGVGKLCRDAGMDDVLIKPVSLEKLAALLARWLPAPNSPE